MQRMQFFGVRTAGSLAFRLFPAWADVLQIEGAVLEGVDLPLGEDVSAHRRAVAALKADPQVRGALVTSHKLRVVRGAADLIDKMTGPAMLCQEVSALYKREGLLWGDACDTVSSGRALEHFLGAGYWGAHPHAAMLSLGAGGAMVALLVHLLTEAVSRPCKIMVIDICERNLAHCASVVRILQTGADDLSFVLSHSAEHNSRLVAGLPPGSLVINATGMGKDLPGSPVTDAVVFPERGAVWELNYRGERVFLQQARGQSAARSLQVSDGWHYFLHGWSSVMAQVFDVPMTRTCFTTFCAASQPDLL